MTKKLLAGLLFVALLAGCASGVKLDDVPVEDKSATSSGVSTQGIAEPQGAAQTGHHLRRAGFEEQAGRGDHGNPAQDGHRAAH